MNGIYLNDLGSCMSCLWAQGQILQDLFKKFLIKNSHSWWSWWRTDVALLSSWPPGPSVSGLMAAAKMQSGADEWDHDRFGWLSRILPVRPKVGVVWVQWACWSDWWFVPVCSFVSVRAFHTRTWCCMWGHSRLEICRPWTLAGVKAPRFPVEVLLPFLHCFFFPIVVEVDVLLKRDPIVCYCFWPAPHPGLSYWLAWRWAGGLCFSVFRQKLRNLSSSACGSVRCTRSMGHAKNEENEAIQ